MHLTSYQYLGLRLEGDQRRIKCKETEQTLHVLLTFLSFRLLEGYEDICFIPPWDGCL